jgi:8-oxo-dGTP pyrophosphatase MutT (NUDIX family)
MTAARADPSHDRARIPIVEQVSAGGVAFRYVRLKAEIALISVGPSARWQLPKGLIDPGETPEITAMREVREEAGIETSMLAPIDTIQYWYVGNRGQQRVRFHKFVHFYLLTYTAGDVDAHDREVNEARWVTLEQAQTMLAFKTERQVVDKATLMLEALTNG